MEVQRRRKSGGPEGRADTPIRQGQGGDSGGYRPSSGGGGGSGIKLPPWLMIILVILFLIFGGKGALDSFLSGDNSTTPVEDSVPTDVPVADAPTAIPADFTPQSVT